MGQRDGYIIPFIGWLFLILLQRSRSVTSDQDVHVPLPTKMSPYVIDKDFLTQWDMNRCLLSDEISMLPEAADVMDYSIRGNSGQKKRES